VFILLVAFGYGAASLVISHFLAGLLMRVDSLHLAGIVFFAFVLIGALAEHKGHV
jgi:hypothetical protein